MKQFLLNARVVNSRQSSKGITNPWRLTLSDGTVTHEASFQSVDELGDKPPGWVPFFPLGVKHPEFAESFALPFETTQGGLETRYPEYQVKLRAAAGKR